MYCNNNNSYNNNNFTDNNHCFIINLPILILKKIIFEDCLCNLDRICFSLTCRGLFEKREKYLYLSTDKFLNHDALDHLQSYKDIFQYYFYQELQNKYEKLCPAKVDLNYDTNQQQLLEQFIEFKERKDEIKLNGYHFDYQLPNLSEFKFKKLNIQSLRSFDQPLANNYLPDTLLEIEFNDKYNSVFDVESLPSSIETIIFGCKYNQPLDKLFVNCRNIKHISFGDYFNQALTPSLFPDTVESLSFGRYFNQPMDENILPSNLKKLTLHNNIPEECPLSLEYLKFIKLNEQPRFTNLSTLMNLKTVDGFPIEFTPLLPISVESISFSNFVSRFWTLQPGYLPSNIINLNFGDLPGYAIVLAEGAIPPNCTTLNLGKYRALDKADIIPNTVKSLHLELSTTQSFRYLSSIPNSIEKLYLFGNNLVIPPGAIPQSVKHLTIDCFIPQVLKGILPSRLEYLMINSTTSISIEKDELPHTLSTLIHPLSQIAQDAICIPPNDEPYAKLNIIFYKTGSQSPRFPANLKQLPPNVFEINLTNDFIIRRLDNQSFLVIKCD